MSSDWLGHHHSRRESLVHRLPALPKLAIALVVIVGTVCAPLRFTGWFMGVAGLLGLTVLLSRVPPLFLLKRLLLLSPFVLGVALVNAFEPSARAPRGRWSVTALLLWRARYRGRPPADLNLLRARVEGDDRKTLDSGRRRRGRQPFVFRGKRSEI